MIVSFVFRIIMIMIIVVVVVVLVVVSMRSLPGSCGPRPDSCCSRPAGSPGTHRVLQAWLRYAVQTRLHDVTDRPPMHYQTVIQTALEMLPIK